MSGAFTRKHHWECNLEIVEKSEGGGGEQRREEESGDAHDPGAREMRYHGETVCQRQASHC